MPTTLLIERVFNDTDKGNKRRRLRGFVVAYKGDDGAVYFGYSQYNKSKESKPLSVSFGKKCAIGRAKKKVQKNFNDLPFAVANHFHAFAGRCAKYFKDAKAIFPNVILPVKLSEEFSDATVNCNASCK